LSEERQVEREIRKAKSALSKLRKKVWRRRQPLFRIPVVFSLGSGGGRILSNIDTDLYGAWKVAVNNSERDLALLGDAVDLKVCCGDGSGSGMDMEKGLSDFLQISDFLVEVVDVGCKDRRFEEPDVIPIIATLGHGFGGGSAPECAKILQEEFPHSIIMAWVITPFYFEGKHVGDRAKESMKNFKDKGIPIIPISNTVAAKRLSLEASNLPLMKVFNAINLRISDIMNSLFIALSAEEGIVESLDRNDLRRIWQPECLTIGSVKYDSVRAISFSSLADVEKSLFIEFGAQMSKPKDVPTTYIIDGNGEVLLKQLTDINTILEKEYGADMSTLKPLILQRKQDKTTFMVIRGGLALGV